MSTGVHMPRAWEDHLLSEEELGEALDEKGLTWRVRLDALFREQREHWPALAQGVEALSRVLVRDIPLGSALIRLQHNPLRLTSTTAVVDEGAVRQRPCPLCPENLPREERGIAYGREYVIVCNPYPILPQHVTIVHREHIPQALAGRFELLLDLAAELSPDLFLLYNGPKCGASVPDHLHFQAAERACLPIARNFAEAQPLVSEPGITISRSAMYPARALLYRGTDRELLRTWFSETLAILAEVMDSFEEPMINLIVFADMAAARDREPVWTVLLFPRARHRPACFFAEEPHRLLISPAAIDLAGLVVVPLRENFERVTADDLRAIFAEVTLSAERFELLVARLRARRKFTQI